MNEIRKIMRHPVAISVHALKLTHPQRSAILKKIKPLLLGSGLDLAGSGHNIIKQLHRFVEGKTKLKPSAILKGVSEVATIAAPILAATPLAELSPLLLATGVAAGVGSHVEEQHGKGRNWVDFFIKDHAGVQLPPRVRKFAQRNPVLARKIINKVQVLQKGAGHRGEGWKDIAKKALKVAGVVGVIGATAFAGYHAKKHMNKPGGKSLFRANFVTGSKKILKRVGKVATTAAAIGVSMHEQQKMQEQQQQQQLQLARDSLPPPRQQQPRRDIQYSKKYQRIAKKHKQKKKDKYDMSDAEPKQALDPDDDEDDDEKPKPFKKRGYSTKKGKGLVMPKRVKDFVRRHPKLALKLMKKADQSPGSGRGRGILSKIESIVRTVGAIAVVGAVFYLKWYLAHRLDGAKRAVKAVIDTRPDIGQTASDLTLTIPKKKSSKYDNYPVAQPVDNYSFGLPRRPKRPQKPAGIELQVGTTKTFAQRREEMKKQAAMRKARGRGKKKRGNREEVWNGLAERTSGGLCKTDLMMSGKGKIISIKKHMAGKGAIKHLRRYQ